MAGCGIGSILPAGLCEGEKNNVPNEHLFHKKRGNRRSMRFVPMPGVGTGARAGQLRKRRRSSDALPVTRQDVCI